MYIHCSVVDFSWRGTKEDIRRMERTLSMNYPVLRQNKRVLLYTFVKNRSLYYFFVYIPSIYPIE